MYKYFLLFGGIISSVTAQFLLKKASVFSFKETAFFIYFIFAGLAYVVSFGLYTIVLKYFPISKASPIMTLGTMAMVILLGVFVFHEIITIKQIAGIILGVAAIILIAL